MQQPSSSARRLWTITTSTWQLLPSWMPQVWEDGGECRIMPLFSPLNRTTRVLSNAAAAPSGHVRALVNYEGVYNPGYQAAYGVLAEVDSHPLDPQAMLFMDWRDSHLHQKPVVKERNDR